MAALKEHGEERQYFREGIFEYVVPCVREIMALRGRETPLPFCIEIIVEAKVLATPTYQHGFVLQTF
jgi:hypothetical protein